MNTPNKEEDSTDMLNTASSTASPKQEDNDDENQNQNQNKQQMTTTPEKKEHTKKKKDEDRHQQQQRHSWQRRHLPHSLTPATITQMLLALFTLLTTTQATIITSHNKCDATTKQLTCDGITDDTTALQAALVACVHNELVLPIGKTCIAYPLTLPSNTNLTIPTNTTLKAGPSNHWPHSPATTHALPFLTAVKNTTNLTITGKGTIDGSGAQWWAGLNNSPGRPHLLTLPHASNVLLENFLMLNAADINAELHGEHYRIFGIRIRGPDYDIAPNTDGIDVQGSDFIIRGVDVQNGDDSICIKSPSWDVLVEDSIVRQGNGLVIGTGGHTNITNITFRNCTAQGTVFGCHIKFKDGQKGKPGVSNITFEDITILEPTKWINQNPISAVPV